MIKGSIQEITIVNIYAPNTGYVRQMLTAIKEKSTVTQ